MMDQVKMFRILEDSGFTKENAEEFISQLRDRDESLATKGDIKDLEISLLKELNQMTFKILGGVAVIVTFIGTVFKFLEHFYK